MRLLALLLLVVGCGGSAKPASTPPPAPDPIPKTAGPACDVVADKLAIVVHADKPDAQGMAKGNLKARCTDDKWSDEARSCFATVETEAEIDGCRQHLDDPQKAGLGKHVPAAAPTAAAAPGPTVEKATPPKAKRSTRGAQPKGDSSDPQEGGE
ncbi:MAG TPA: hypothetical protein VIV11_25115 [Kofleriaceae bacterium]